MNDYTKVRFELKPCDEIYTDIMAALLADRGYESFEPDNRGLTAYIRAGQYDPSAVSDALSEFPIEGVVITYDAETVEGRDWNSEWEKNYFKPIVIDGECAIHSSFHTDIPVCRYDIVIDPKMAFGTGHHATTSQVVRQLLHADLAGRSVIDMGTGTGILAILAAMRGASSVTAIEIDEFAVTNARENVAINHHPEINVIHGDASALADVAAADFFVANINRNIITGDIAAYAKALKPGGLMILSGFYEHDIPAIAEAAAPYGLHEATHTVDNDWTCLVLTSVAQ